MADEPVCIDVSVRATIGGSVQIVKYEYTEKFDYSWHRTYSVPGDWDEEQINEFQSAKTTELHEALDDGFATPKVEALMAERDQLA